MFATDTDGASTAANAPGRITTSGRPPEPGEVRIVGPLAASSVPVGAVWGDPATGKVWRKTSSSTMAPQRASTDWLPLVRLVVVLVAVAVIFRAVRT